MKNKFSLLLLLIYYNCLFSQVTTLNFRELNTSNGLSSNTITSIKQDKFGQIWLGTSNGLNKYNSKDFKVFRNIPRDKYSLSNSEINDILIDKEGYVWIGTINGLNRYDPKKNKFRRFYRRPSNKFSLSNSLIICSLEMPKGNIWFGTANGVSIYNKKNGKFKRFLQGNSFKNAKPIHDIYRDKKGRTWLATNNGIIKVVLDENKKFAITEYNIDDSRTNFNINTIIEIAPNLIGLGTKFDGLLYFDVETNKFINPKNLNIPKNLDIRDLEFDNKKNLWIGTTSGIFIVNPQNKTILSPNFEQKNNGVTKNYIRKFFKDKNGCMWLATQNRGVIMWDESYQNFTHFKNHNSYNNIANSIVSGTNRKIYYGTENGVVNVLNNNGEISELLTLNDDNRNINTPIKSLFYYKEDLLFIGTQNRGIICYNISSKLENKGLLSKELNDYLKNVTVYDIKKDSKNNLFIGTSGKGLVIYNLETKKLENFNRPKIATNIVKSIYIDEKDNAIIGGIGGVSTLSVDEKDIIKIDNYFNDKQFTTYNVSSVYKDSNNINWIGTTTRGIYSIRNNKIKQTRIISRNKFSTVNSILEDSKGVLWLSTDKGIIKYNSKTQESFLYNQNNIINNNFRPNSSLKIDDELYFGNLNGLTKFNPDKIIKVSKVPKVILSELKIKNEVIAINEEDGILSNSLKYTDVLELNHYNSNFSISFALPNFINPEGNRYAYRLKGLDDTWMSTKQTEAFFTLQNAGTYEFQVRAANHDNVWSKKMTKIKIIVHPAPWRTWWAYIIYILIILSVFYGVFWFLQSKERLKNKLELEYLENKRIEELNKSKLQFFTNISHEFRTPLTLILGPLQNILNDYTGTNAIYKKLKIVESSANHLLRLINRLMDFRKLESNQLELKAAEGNIVKFLREIYLSFSEHAKNGNYNYTFKTSDEEILVYFDRYKLERVFYNLISNALRFTPSPGTISIEVKKLKNEVEIQIIDSGVGIPDEFLDKIFDRFFEIPKDERSKNIYNKGTGIGLSIAYNIVKLHYGSITANNNKTQGSNFTVKIPLGNKHLKNSEIQQDFKISDDISQYVIQMEPLKFNSTLLDKNTLKDKQYTILIVEDNVVLRSFIKEILKPKYNILVAENGKVALEKAVKHLPDLIISDVIMPEMVGTELCSKIKTNMATSHIPVILLTSRTALIYKFEGLESGADDYISKPFDLKEFHLKIQNLLLSKQRIKDRFASNENYTDIEVSLPSLDEKLLAKAFNIVNKNIANQDFNIDMFAELLGVSRSILFTKIKAWANTTPNDFIQGIRLNYAAKLLEKNKFNVSEVSYKVGFKRPKYFSQCFQKKFDLTPSKYAKKFKPQD